MEKRIRVGIISRTLSLGGAEMLMSQILEFCDPERIEWVFFGVFDDDLTAPAMRETVHRYCPTIPQAQIREACETCDVVIAWGMPVDDLVPARPRRCKVILAALGMCEFTRHVMISSPHADAVVAVSQAAAETIPESERHKTVMISSGLDLRRVPPLKSPEQMRREWYLRPGQKALVFLGRIAVEKNPIAVARAISGLHRLGRTEWRGIVVGPLSHAKYRAMSYFPDMEQLSEEIAPGLVRFTGAIDHVGDALAAADHLILPSFIEGNSLALLEMWAAGKPVLATPVGLVAHEHRDFVRTIEPSSMGLDLARALVADLDDPAGTQARVARAQRTVIDSYSCESIGRKWTDLMVGLAGA